MSEVAKAVKPLFDKFIDFFDIFDLSFFVSGATFIGAIAWADLTPSLTQLVVDLMLTMPSVAVVMLALASYVSGMTCFALGRWIRGQLRAIRERYRDRRAERSDDPEVKAARVAQRRRKQHRLYEELRLHGVLVRHEDDTYTVHEDFDRIPWLRRYMVDGGLPHETALYVRLWAEVRQRERFAPSFSLVRRYWVSAATLDGLFIACLSWAALLALVDKSDPEQMHSTIDFALHDWLPSVATIVGALFCLREAGRYDEHQCEELVATLLFGYDLPDEGLLDFVPPVPHETVAEAKVKAAEVAKAKALAEAKQPEAKADEASKAEA